MSRSPVVTVDGPAGSGKTTLGRRLALALGLPLIDTGLFYRGITWAAIRSGLDADHPEAVAELARRTVVEVNTEPADPGWEVRVDGVDPGLLVRDPRHARLLSAISQIPEVRQHLLPLQREPASRGAVAVGRDCGTVVFPEATVKLYLLAEESLRAERRRAQLAGRGARVDRGAARAEIADRDLGDAASMAAAPDAVVIDTGTASIDEMEAIALRRCAAAGLLPRPPRDGERR